jgi:uncharacterized protein (DUF2267 family)
MATNSTVFDHAVRTADDWLASVAREFDTDDRGFAYRTLRAWLHGLRDELTVEACAHFAAQLPEVLRGIYYEGWDPSQVPVDHDLDAYLHRFAREAQVRPSEVRHVASTLTAALHQHLSGAQLTTALEQLPQRLRELLWVAPRNASQPRAEQPPGRADDRLTQLEREVRTLASALNELVHGLEHTPMEEPADNHATRAAHRAHQILLAGQPNAS